MLLAAEGLVLSNPVELLWLIAMRNNLYEREQVAIRGVELTKAISPITSPLLVTASKTVLLARRF